VGQSQDQQNPLGYFPLNKRIKIMIQEWKIGDTGTVTINTSEKVVILLDENSEYNKSFVGGMKIPFYDWYNGSEGYDKMIYTWGYDGTLVDRVHYVWKQVLNSLDAIDDSVSDEEIEAFVRDLAKVAEDNKDKINYIPVLEE
jgi:hypothetical protein